jgi:hypothetical protein
MEVAKAAGTLSRASVTAGRSFLGHPVATAFHINGMNVVGRMPQVIAEDRAPMEIVMSELKAT